jgi:hypothetical protein
VIAGGGGGLSLGVVTRHSASLARREKTCYGGQGSTACRGALFGKFVLWEYSISRGTQGASERDSQARVFSRSPRGRVNQKRRGVHRREHPLFDHPRDASLPDPGRGASRESRRQSGSQIASGRAGVQTSQSGVVIQVG